MKKTFLLIFAIILISAFISGCDNRTADVASYNLSKAADEFEVFRRVVFYNGITDQYILVVEGYSSIKSDTTDKQLELTVKTAPGVYMKHFLGLSDNVTYFVEQIEPSRVSTGQYRVIFKPSTIIPDIQIK